MQKFPSLSVKKIRYLLMQVVYRVGFERNKYYKFTILILNFEHSLFNIKFCPLPKSSHRIYSNLLFWQFNNFYIKGCNFTIGLISYYETTVDEKTESKQMIERVSKVVNFIEATKENDQQLFYLDGLKAFR